MSSFTDRFKKMVEDSLRIKPVDWAIDTYVTVAKSLDGTVFQVCEAKMMADQVTMVMRKMYGIREVGAGGEGFVTAHTLKPFYLQRGDAIELVKETWDVSYSRTYNEFYGHIWEIGRSNQNGHMHYTAIVEDLEGEQVEFFLNDIKLCDE